jgi:hypothetical protein
MNEANMTKQNRACPLVLNIIWIFATVFKFGKMKTVSKNLLKYFKILEYDNIFFINTKQSKAADLIFSIYLPVNV